MVHPSPAIPATPIARPFKREVGAQVKGKPVTETNMPGLEPSVDWMEITSWERSPP